MWVAIIIHLAYYYDAYPILKDAVDPPQETVIDVSATFLLCIITLQY